MLMEQLRYAVEQNLIYGVDIMSARYHTLVQVTIDEVIAILEGVGKQLHGVNLRGEIRICCVGGTATAVNEEVFCGLSAFSNLLCQIFRSLG